MSLSYSDLSLRTINDLVNRVKYVSLFVVDSDVCLIMYVTYSANYMILSLFHQKFHSSQNAVSWLEPTWLELDSTRCIVTISNDISDLPWSFMLMKTISVVIDVDLPLPIWSRTVISVFLRITASNYIVFSGSGGDWWSR